jgi:lysozyme
MDIAALREQLERHEGLRLKAYHDSVGKLSIGVGRNLDDKGISRAEAMVMLDNDIAEHCALLDKYLPWWRALDVVRQQVIANMAFNMGIGPSAEHPQGKLLTFRNTLDNVQRGLYDEAAGGMAASLWARQVGKRAQELIEMMRTGVNP